MSKVSIKNISSFPIINKSLKYNVKYVAHYGEIIKLILIKTQDFPNHIVSISTDNRLKLWNLQTNDCIKTLNLEFFTKDLIHIKENFVLVSGEKIVNIDLKSEKISYIIQPKIGHFIEFNKIILLNDSLALSSSLNLYYLIFDISTGKIVKKINMNKTHYLCCMELTDRNAKDKDGNLIGPKVIEIEESDDEFKEKLEQSKINNNNNENNENVNENNNSNLDEFNNNSQENTKTKKLKKIIIRDIGSAKCLNTINGHKQYVYALINIISNNFKNCFCSGSRSNLIKLINYENEDIKNFIGHDDTITCLTQIKDYLFSGSFDRTIKKWDINNQSCLETFNEHFGTVIIIKKFKNDNYMLTIGLDRKIKIWKDEKVIKTFSYERSRINTCEEIDDNTFIFGDNKSDIFIKKYIFYD